MPKVKNNKSDFATHADLARMSNDILSSMHEIYSQQNMRLDKLEHEFREFKAEMQEFKAEMQEFKAEMLEFKAEMVEFKNTTLTMLSEIVGELRAIREERVIAPHQIARHTDKLDNHEERIVHLEKVVIVA